MYTIYLFIVRKTKLLLLASAWFLCLAPALAQHVHHHGYGCATDSMVQWSLLQNPHLKLHQDSLEEHTQRWVKAVTPSKSGVKYIVPTVVHIIHDDKPTTVVSPEQVRNAIEIMTRDFLKNNSDTTNLHPSFQPIAGDAEMEFRLATRDPQGNCTNGITYTFSEQTNAGGEGVKNLVGWPTNQYLNIWVVDRIASGAGAYAFYPGTAPRPENEGIVCTNGQFGNTGLSGSSNFAERTMTHELGHYFNLPHTWGNSNTPGLATNCNLDDFVFDTPNTVGTTGQSCNLNQVLCGTLDNVQNYMDYSSCGSMFTDGQVARMDAAINSAFGSRNTLWQPANLVATGTDDQAAPCLVRPQAGMVPSRNFNICGNETVNFIGYDFAGNVDDSVSYSWLAPGSSTPAGSGKVLTTTYSQEGTYDVTLIVTAANGLADTLILPQFVTVAPDSAKIKSPGQFALDDPSFPQISADMDSNFTFVDQVGSSFSFVDLSNQGRLAIQSNVGNRAFGDTMILQLPPLDYGSTGVPPFLTFDLAAAPRGPFTTDRLRVVASADCGRTWTLLREYSGSTGMDPLFTAPSAIPTYTPSASDWQVKTILASLFRAEPYVLIRFEHIYLGGNSIYIDNISYGQVPVSLDQPLEDDQRIRLLQNGEFSDARFDGLSSNKPYTIETYSMEGKKMNTWKLNQSSQALIRDFMSKPLPGVYLIKVSSEDELEVFRLLVK